MKKERVATHICTTCGTEDAVMRRRRGNGYVESVLWLALLVPGLLYTAWRNMEDIRLCRTCGKESMIPLATPVGRRMHEELDAYRCGVGVQS